jgi:hypothetical protein
MITKLDESAGDLVSALSSKEREALVGLVVGAFARAGIALPQYTGDLWNSGVIHRSATCSPVISSASTPTYCKSAGNLPGRRTDGRRT